MIESALFLGLLSAISVLILLHKTGIRKKVKQDAWLDIIVTALLTVLFAGTILGLATAVVAGLLVSIYLLVTRNKPTKRGINKETHRRIAVRHGRRI